MELTKVDHRQSRDTPEILTRKLLREKFGKRAKALGLQIPDRLLALADEGDRVSRR